MTAYDYWIRKIPEYDKFMYLDGWTPEEILTAVRYKMLEEAEDDEAEFE